MRHPLQVSGPCCRHPGNLLLKVPSSNPYHVFTMLLAQENLQKKCYVVLIKLDETRISKRETSFLEILQKESKNEKGKTKCSVLNVANNYRKRLFFVSNVETICQISAKETSLMSPPLLQKGTVSRQHTILTDVKILILYTNWDFASWMAMV